MANGATALSLTPERPHDVRPAAMLGAPAALPETVTADLFAKIDAWGQLALATHEQARQPDPERRWIRRAASKPTCGPVDGAWKANGTGGGEAAGVSDGVPLAVMGPTSSTGLEYLDLALRQRTGYSK